MITADWISDIEVKTRIVMAKVPFNKKKNLFYKSMDMEARKILVKNTFLITCTCPVVLTWNVDYEKERERGRIEPFEVQMCVCVFVLQIPFIRSVCVIEEYV